jgi:hypothetical protein
VPYLFKIVRFEATLPPGAPDYPPLATLPLAVPRVRLAVPRGQAGALLLAGTRVMLAESTSAAVGRGRCCRRRHVSLLSRPRIPSFRRWTGQRLPVCCVAVRVPAAGGPPLPCLTDRRGHPPGRYPGRTEAHLHGCCPTNDAFSAFSVFFIGPN